MTGHYIYEYLENKVNCYLVISCNGNTIEVVPVDAPLSEPIIHNYNDLCLKYDIKIVKPTEQNITFESMSAKGVKFKWNDGETSITLQNPSKQIKHNRY